MIFFKIGLIIFCKIGRIIVKVTNKKALEDLQAKLTLRLGRKVVNQKTYKCGFTFKTFFNSHIFLVFR